jgi:hypothetical protein
MSEERAIPMIDDIELDYVTKIVQRTSHRTVSAPVAGLAGDVQQLMGRASYEIEIAGILVGDDAASKLATLQNSVAEGIERTFTADITTTLELDKVIITAAEFTQLAGRPNHYEYHIVLRESPPLPPPAQLSSFGGLDGFDLGFDTDVLGDISDMASDLQGAIDAVSDVVGQLEALSSLADLGLSNPLTPLSDAAGSIGTAAEGVGGVASALADLLGGGS